MLNKLVIKNFALIDYSEINFTQGFNVLSGETGAGKSIIIESLNFVLGAKADKSIIRSGEIECSVSAEFAISNNKNVQSIMVEQGLECEDLIIIFRKFTIDGKSSIKINGNTVTLSMLKKITSALVDVHGQSEHFLLLSTTNQLKLLDKFGGDSVFNLKNKISTIVGDYKNIKNELDILGGDENKRLIRLDVLSYQINEIENACLTENEEEELLSLKEKLVNQEKIATSLSSAKLALTEEGGVNDILSNAIRVLSNIENLGDEYASICERLNSIYAESDDVADTISSIMDNDVLFDANLDDVENRLDIIKKLKKKYGNNFEEINNFLINAKEEYSKLENFSQLAEKLLIEKENLEKEIYQLYSELSLERQKIAKTFSENVIVELKQLAMLKSQFVINFSEKPTLENCNFESLNGFDNIEFMFSANLGEPLKPLSNVISGGEMSRFMLSIKTQSSASNDISTFIFDEIDAGISGAVAKIVAEKLFKISLNTQVIAITHLPQIFVFADNNLLISKIENKEKTHTTIKQLTNQDKLNELIRLTGGTVSNLHSVEHAKDLLNDANNIKLKLKN